MSARPKAVRRSPRRNASGHPLAPARRVGRAAEGLVQEEAPTLANAATTTTTNVSATANASAATTTAATSRAA